ncbi:MAG: CarD family transcriptional regulator [Thermodesulfobacteriota bacterium]
MFNVGDVVVYPAHGVGVVESIEAKEISGTTHTFFILTILGNGMTVMVPVDNAELVGLRDLVDKKTVTRVYDILRDKDAPPDTQTWNRRYREYMEKIKTGSILEVATVLRDLYLLKFDKELSFGEKKMFDTAKNLLVQELSIVNKTTSSKVEEELHDVLAA